MAQGKNYLRNPNVGRKIDRWAKLHPWGSNLWIAWTYRTTAPCPAKPGHRNYFVDAVYSIRQAVPKVGVGYSQLCRDVVDIYLQDETAVRPTFFRFCRKLNQYIEQRIAQDLDMRITPITGEADCILPDDIKGIGMLACRGQGQLQVGGQVPDHQSGHGSSTS